MKSFNSSCVVLMFTLTAFFYGLRLSAQRAGGMNFDSLNASVTRLNEDTGKVMKLISLANSLDLKDSVHKVAYLGKALSLANTLHWRKGVVKANQAIGNMFCNSYSDNSRALVYFRNAAAACFDDREELSISYNLIAYVWDRLNKYDSALQYYQKALDLNPETRKQIGLLANIGAVNNDLGDYLNALDHYSRALRLNSQILAGRNTSLQDSLTNIGLLFCLGDIYLQMSQFDDALANFQAGLKLNESLHENFIDLKALQGIGQSHYAKKQYQQAINYYLSALQKARDQRYKKARAEILNELGTAYFAIGEIGKSLACGKQALALITEKSNDPLVSKLYINMAKIYAINKDYVTAIQFLKRSIASSADLGAKAYERDGWEVLSQAYEQAGQPAEALKAYKRFVLLKDSVINVEKVKKMKATEMQLRLEGQHQADSLRQAVLLQKERVKKYPVYAGLAIVLSFAVFVLIGYYRQRRNNRIIQKVNQEIIKEQRISENLLLNILPSDVAIELKANGTVKAKQFDRVTVLFTDFVNFTTTSQHVSPQALVAELDACFKAFDEIMGRYGIEKIKTVGDAYLAVGGLPVETPDHAIVVVRAAIEIRDFMLNRRADLNEQTFEIRLGIHSGSVIAGVVGVKKFAYDVWGDTVNTAARMQQNSEPGKINVSHDTYQLVKDHFACTYRGELSAKNKGQLKMYFLD